MIAKVRTRPVHVVILAAWMLVMMAATQGQTAFGELALERVFEDAVFNEPTFLAGVPDGSGRMFVLERGGVVKAGTLDNGAVEVVLDISDRVSTEGEEMGLLGLAFAPDFAESGMLYLNYTTDGPRRTIVSRFTMANGIISPDSEFVILEQAQPYPNHNAGMMAFGPDDGYLYIAFGDGGDSNDPDGNGQNLGTILGSIIRIDVSNSSEAEPYTVPGDNPFVGTAGARPEIYAYGMRNPWRFSIDPETGVMHSGDVGERNIEEINVIEPGGNYGWSIIEGDRCVTGSGCDTTGLILPTVQYPWGDGNCSVTGGYVYRGSLAPSLTGAYIYGDFCSGRIWALAEGQEPVLVLESGLMVSSFGLDENGEMFILGLGGEIHRLLEPGAITPTPTVTATAPASPTPAEPTTTPTEGGASPTPTTGGATPTVTPTPVAGPSEEGGLGGMEIALIGVGVAVVAAAAGAFAFIKMR